MTITSETTGSGKLTYKAAIVGCGRIGCAFDDDPRRGVVSTHAGAYVKTPGFVLAALVDVDREKLDRYGRKFKVPGLYTDASAMLKNERPDVVSICTWNTTHLELVRAAADAGVKAVFCEKPIAETLSAADEMVDLCAKGNIVLLVDHQRRFDPFHQRVAGYLQEGRLGRIQQATCYYTAGVANTGSHLFDLLRFYFGDAQWVQGRLSANSSGNASDPNIDGWVGFANSLTVFVQACDVKAYSLFEIHILGTLGRFHLTSSAYELTYEEARPSSRFAEYAELYPAALPIRNDHPHEIILFGLRHLLDCLTRGVTPISSGEDGRASLEIICALRESVASGGRLIELPLTTSTITIQSR